MRTFLILPLLILLCGCGQYVAPGGRADFTKLGLTQSQVANMTDFSVQEQLAKKPLVTFPANIAVVRVQAPDYNSYSYSDYASTTLRGAYSVITRHDIEKDEDFDALARLPKVEGVAPIKAILLDKKLNTDLELRNAAAKLNANLLLYYTLETAFRTETHAAPLTVITLGMAPNEEAKVTCTASAVLMDTRNGYIYAVVESTKVHGQLASAWTNAEAMDQVRQRTEREAFEGLVADFVKAWPDVVKKYDKPRSE